MTYCYAMVVYDTVRIFDKSQESQRENVHSSQLFQAQKGGPKRGVPKKPPAGGSAPTMSHMEALVERLNKRRRDIAGGGPSRAPQPNAASAERPELVKGLMDKIVTQSKGDSESDTDRDHKDDDCWSD